MGGLCKRNIHSACLTVAQNAERRRVGGWRREQMEERGEGARKQRKEGLGGGSGEENR